jgi:DNA-binding response OmpR family regulator
MKKILVLIVEDDTNIREMYADAFKAADIQTITAENGEIGVTLALKHHPDAILMDIEMPVMGGHEAVNNIRKEAWGKDAKIVYLTNKSDPENIVHAVERGSDEYIIKANCTPKEVVNKVRVVMHSAK